VEGPRSIMVVVNDTPTACMSCLKMAPSWSFFTLPMKAVLAPREAMPASVLATEPPEQAVVGPICL